MIKCRIKNNWNFTGVLPWMHCKTNELLSRMCPGSSGSAVPVSWLWHVCKRSPDTGSREWNVQCQRSRAGSRPPEQSSPGRRPAWVHLSAPCPRTHYTPLPRTTQPHHAEKAHVCNTCVPKMTTAMQCFWTNFALTVLKVPLSWTFENDHSCSV